MKASLYTNINKLSFYKTSIKYLSLIITTKGLKIEFKKINTVRNQKKPYNIRDILSFIGFANFYRIFIKGFSKILLLLTELTKNKKNFILQANSSPK